MQKPMENNKQEKSWYLFDAKGEYLGRLATKISNLLRGKEKIDFAYNSDNGDYVVVVNASKILLSGKKEEQKRYYKHTGYIGNLKEKTVTEIRKSKPEFMIKHAVAGMLPKNKLRDKFLGRLKIYSGNDHPHKNIKFINQE